MIKWQLLLDRGHLHRRCSSRHRHGQLPMEEKRLTSLPGKGRSTPLTFTREGRERARRRRPKEMGKDKEKAAEGDVKYKKRVARKRRVLSSPRSINGALANATSAANCTTTGRSALQPLLAVRSSNHLSAGRRREESIVGLKQERAVGGLARKRDLPLKGRTTRVRDVLCASASPLRDSDHHAAPVRGVVRTAAIKADGRATTMIMCNETTVRKRIVLMNGLQKMARPTCSTKFRTADGTL
jgi:hypothetical protein